MLKISTFDKTKKKEQTEVHMRNKCRKLEWNVYLSEQNISSLEIMS